MKIERQFERKLESELPAFRERNLLAVRTRGDLGCPTFRESGAIGRDELPDQVEAIVLPLHLEIEPSDRVGDEDLAWLRTSAPDSGQRLQSRVEDEDAAVERALTRGARLVRPVETQFWRDRIGWVLDPAGHMRTIATRVEGTTEEQRQDRWSNISSTPY